VAALAGDVAASLKPASDRRPWSLLRIEDTMTVRSRPSALRGKLMVPPGFPVSANLINSVSRYECADDDVAIGYCSRNAPSRAGASPR
jgi:hypothetical protein